MPPGSSRLRSRGRCATEKEEHGGAAKTASYSPAPTARSRRPATSGRSTSCSSPPSAMSTAS
eukprot:4067735-Pleurochrysis_carterae.AAC.1